MPRPEDVQALKEIAQLGALHGLVEVSSAQLAELLETSQQTASRRILDLERSGYVRREMGVRRTLLRLSEEGVNILSREYAQYKRLFEHRHRLQLHGRITSGSGEGAYYLGQKGYVDQFKALLGFAPYPGTLNVEIEGAETNKLRILKASDPIRIEEFQDKNRTFGAVDAWRAHVRDVECALILPKRTHHVRTVELIAPERLRDRLRVKDGDEVDISVQLSETRGA